MQQQQMQAKDLYLNMHIEVIQVWVLALIYV